MIAPEALVNLRIDAAQRGKWNIGFFAAGFIFWVFVAITGAHFELHIARIYWLVGTFLIAPIAILASRFFKADPSTQGNSLAGLVGNTHVSAIAMTFPIVLAAFVYHPEMLPLVMAIAYCVDFYVMTWAFDTPLFGIHAAIRTFAACLIWFAFPEWRMSVLPAVVAAIYLATMLLSPVLRIRWLRKHQTIS